MIEEIHKGCGGVIVSGQYLTYPPIPFKKCTKCGATKDGERQKIERVEVELPVNKSK